MAIKFGIIASLMSHGGELQTKKGWYIMTVYEITSLPKLFDSYKHASFFTIDELERYINKIVGRDNVKVTTSELTNKNTAKIFVSMGGVKMQFGTFLKLENNF